MIYPMLSSMLSNMMSSLRSKVHFIPIPRQAVLIDVGGGHNPSGASSSNGGMVIDLAKYLNKVEVSPEAKTAKVQGGALWEDVDNATSLHGLGTVGGTVSTVSLIRLVTVS